MEFHNDFFVANDIDIHQLNLGPFRSLQILFENPFKNVFLHFLNNKCIINSYFWEETITLRKRRRFISEFSIYFHFSLVW
jgi:hypothetical protein